MSSSIIKSLKNHSLFHNFLEDELLFISQHSEVKQYQAGETIMTQGSYGNQLYLLEKGKVSVYVSLPGDTKKLATILESGQIFGEVTFLTETPATASIIAKNNCLCLIFSREILNMFYLSHPIAAYKFVTNIIEQTREKIIHQIHLLSSLLKKAAKGVDISSQYALQMLKHKVRCKKIPNANIDLNYLKEIHFFSGLKEQQLFHLLSYISIHQYERGYPFQLLNTNSRLCIPYSGAVMMFIKQDNVLSKSIAVFGTGELFLENPTPIFPEFQDNFAYLSSEKSIILALDFDSYYKLQHSEPAIFFHISKEINHHIARLVYLVNREFIRINCEYEDLIR
ncbi:cyclic nucleotide-binding protein [Legionella nautarum]|uniref:Cyclic nucleotide-binding protein n=1 Tax=Legionella nautarum TaxID=45070 RepID=A0A0W0WK69_9GAMM|nr:cyclic nucleotide-binding domain-containing protein [Legionella nautarum]KTD32733.1 cyclic nucleotide-binding protein [Legionella nautarum]